MKTLVLLFGIVLFSCSGSSYEPSNLVIDERESEMLATNAGAKDAMEASNVAAIDRKLIKNGSLTLETNDVVETKGEIDKICKVFKAYIASEGQENYGERVQYNQQIRVPSVHFDALLQRIEALGLRVQSKNIDTRDVTEEFIDVEARLETKKELETRYRDLLKQAKAVADIMSIETQINAVRSEIESMEGRLNYLKNQVAYSTLNVIYFKWQGTDFGFGSKFIQSLENGWDNLLSFLIGLVSIWPFIILSIALVWLFLRIRKRRIRVD